MTSRGRGRDRPSGLTQKRVPRGRSMIHEMRAHTELTTRAHASVQHARGSRWESEGRAPCVAPMRMIPEPSKHLLEQRSIQRAVDLPEALRDGRA